jgi:hypothetical protein
MIEIIYAISFMVLPVFMWWVVSRIKEIQERIFNYQRYAKQDHKFMVKELDTLYRRVSQLELKKAKR